MEPVQVSLHLFHLFIRILPYSIYESLGKLITKGWLKWCFCAQYVCLIYANLLFMQIWYEKWSTYRTWYILYIETNAHNNMNHHIACPLKEFSDSIIPITSLSTCTRHKEEHTALVFLYENWQRKLSVLWIRPFVFRTLHIYFMVECRQINAILRMSYSCRKSPGFAVNWGKISMYFARYIYD